MSRPRQNALYLSARSEPVFGRAAPPRLWSAVERERRAARLAVFDVGISLKDRIFPALNTVRTYEMNVLRGVHAILWRIHMITGWSCVDFIARKLGVHIVNRCQFTLGEVNLHLQKLTRDLRVSYLRAKILDGGFDIRISTALRFAERSLQLREQVGNFPGAVNQSIGSFQRGIEAIWREIQLVVSSQQVMAEFAEKVTEQSREART